MDAGHDVLDEVLLAQLRDGGRYVIFADGAPERVVEADVGLRGTHGDSGQDPVIFGNFEWNRGAPAAAGTGEIVSFLDEARLEQRRGGAGDGGLGQSGGLHELAARDDGIEAYEVETGLTPGQWTRRGLAMLLGSV